MTGRDQLCSLEASGRTAVLRHSVYVFCCPHCVGQLADKCSSSSCSQVAVGDPGYCFPGSAFDKLALPLSVMYNPTNSG